MVWLLCILDELERELDELAVDFPVRNRNIVALEVLVQSMIVVAGVGVLGLVEACKGGELVPI